MYGDRTFAYDLLLETQRSPHEGHDSPPELHIYKFGSSIWAGAAARIALYLVEWRAALAEVCLCSIDVVVHDMGDSFDRVPLAPVQLFVYECMPSYRTLHPEL